MTVKKLLATLVIFPVIAIASEKVDITKEYLTDEQLFSLLNDSNEEIRKIKSQYVNGEHKEALTALTVYFKEKMSSSYFFDWKTFETRFKDYSKKYESKLSEHTRRKDEHLALHPAFTKWKLPLTGLNGIEITPYLSLIHI